MVYTREECKKLINELNVIDGSDKQIHICKKKITSYLMESILLNTKNCRNKISERIYWILNDIEDYPICEQCGKRFLPRFFGIKIAYRESKFCNIKCVNQNETKKQLTKETWIINYDKDHPFKNEEFKKKLININLKNHGVPYLWQSNQTKESIKKTNLERYDVEQVMHNPNIAEASHKYRTKKITLPSSKVINYQGYENVGILKLLEDGYLEEEIKTRKIDMPKLKYFYNDANRIYFPDIYIPKDNLIIEVKSEYTYNKEIEQNLIKKDAVINAGYNYEFWICSSKEILEIIRYKNASE